jgi:hypothetical protein
MAMPLHGGDTGTFESRFTRKVLYLSPTLEAAAAGECAVLFVCWDKGLLVVCAAGLVSQVFESFWK